MMTEGEMLIFSEIVLVLGVAIVLYLFGLILLMDYKLSKAKRRLIKKENTGK